MWPVHARLAELWALHAKKPLQGELLQEFILCMDAHVNRAWKIAKLENLSLVASLTNDTEWQHEICVELEKLTG